MRRLVRRMLLVALCALSVPAAASKAKMPKWVTSPYKAYPAKTYFAAVGSSTNRAAAEVEAIRGISALFGQSVSSTTVSSKRMTQAQEDGKVAVTTSSASIDDGVLRQVDADDVIAVEVKDAWKDESRATWYVIAVMNKQSAASVYTSMITQNQAEIRSLLEKARNDPSFESYAMLDFAESVAVVTDGYLKRLAVISPSGAESLSAPELSAVSVHARLRELAALIPIAVLVNADSNGRVAKAFSETVAERGFNVVDLANMSMASGYRYLLHADVANLEQVITDKRGLFVIDFTIDGAFTDLSTGEDLIPFNISGSEGSKTAENVKVRVYATMEKAVRQRFNTAFNGYLDGFAM